MDFGFTEEQQEVQGLARRILEDKVTDELLRQVEGRGDARFDRGHLGLRWPRPACSESACPRSSGAAATG